MTEERITETRTPEGNTHIHTTIVTDRPRSGGGCKWFGLLALIVVRAIAVLVMTRLSDSEVAKDTAVADAVAQVGEAVGQVGDAAEAAVDKVSEQRSGAIRVRPEITSGLTGIHDAPGGCCFLPGGVCLRGVLPRVWYRL